MWWRDEAGQMGKRRNPWQRNPVAIGTGIGVCADPEGKLEAIGEPAVGAC